MSNKVKEIKLDANGVDKDASTPNKSTPSCYLFICLKYPEYQKYFKQERNY